MNAIARHYHRRLFIPTLPPASLGLDTPRLVCSAMENWGLITYRSTALLANSNASSTTELQRVAVVVCHEMAHQWAGNLVTPAWWTSLWLNEGELQHVAAVLTSRFSVSSVGMTYHSAFHLAVRPPPCPLSSRPS